MKAKHEYVLDLKYNFDTDAIKLDQSVNLGPFKTLADAKKHAATVNKTAKAFLDALVNALTLSGMYNGKRDSVSIVAKPRKVEHVFAASKVEFLTEPYHLPASISKKLHKSFRTKAR